MADLRSSRSFPGRTYEPSAPGYTPPKTREIIPSTPRTVIPPAERATPSDAIYMAMRVQLELNRLGYYSGAITGKIDAATRTALRAFQQAQGLTESGTMDNATLSRLGINY